MLFVALPESLNRRHAPWWDTLFYSLNSHPYVTQAIISDYKSLDAKKDKTVPALNQAPCHEGIIFKLSTKSRWVVSFMPQLLHPTETSPHFVHGFYHILPCPTGIQNRKTYRIHIKILTVPKTSWDSAAENKCWSTYHSLSLLEYEPSNDSALVVDFGGMSSFVLEL